MSLRYVVMQMFDRFLAKLFETINSNYTMQHIKLVGVKDVYRGSHNGVSHNDVFVTI